jgi:hypothetical protein
MEPRQPLPWDRVTFGPLRTLNVRASMLSGAEAAARVEGWLRSKQVELSGDVLLITGRGKGSLGGVPVVRDSTKGVLDRLRRLGVIAGYGVDTPGSFVVQLAPLRALLEAPARRRAKPLTPLRRDQTVKGLRPETLDRLRYLAGRSLDSLGVRDVTEPMLNTEMMLQFSKLARAIPSGGDVDKWLDGAITRATREYDEHDDR